MSNLLTPGKFPAGPRDESDPRIGHLIRAGALDSMPHECHLAMIGFPSDEGVRTNGGRVGAAAGPDAIRERLYRMTADPQHAAHADAFRQTIDVGNLVCTGELAEDQKRLGHIVAKVLGGGLIPIILGGGHETAYGHFLGYVEGGQPAAIVNIDAHADVRPLVDGLGHSGSPFRQALEHSSGACQSYTVCGLAPYAVAAQHVDYIVKRGGRALWFDETNEQTASDAIDRSAGRVMLSMDLDAVDRGHAPGVSAPNPRGMQVGTWLAIAERAGRSPLVQSLDVVELNPKYDIDAATASLAALTVWHFVRGVATRDAEAARVRRSS